MRDSSAYFATLDAKSIAGALEERIDTFYRHAQEGALTALLRKSHALANGLTINGTGAISYSITRGGEQGELVHSVENHYRSVGNGLLTLTTAQRPAVQCGAANSDYRSLAQTLLANGLIEYHLTEQGVEERLKRAVKSAIFLLEGHIFVEWDAQAGAPYTSDENDRPVMAGEPKLVVLGLLDVVRDPYASSWDELDWLIVREWANKHELAARYPELSEDIRSQQLDDNKQRRVGLRDRVVQETDTICLWKFFHRPSAAVEGGRMVSFLNSSLVLYDGPNPYGELPVYRVVCDEIEGTPFGTSPMLDLMGPQDAINALDTSIHTNMLGRGIGNILVPDTADMNVETLSTSMNAIKWKGTQKPEPLEWPTTPPEFFQLKAEKIAAMETLSGINSVVRGNPSENVGADSSGAKLALIQAQAIQSNSGLEKSYTNLIRKVTLAIITRYRDFGGAVPRLARLAGKANQYLVKEFTSEDLSGIDRVSVDVGSPIMRSVSGKMTVADKVMALPNAADRALYLGLVKTGTYEPMFEAGQSQQMRIRQENEMLMEGRPHQPLLTDPHWLEIPQHLTVLDNPKLREPTPENQAIQQAVLDVITQHRQLFSQMPPDLVLMVGGPEALAMWQTAQQALGLVPPPPTQDGTQPPATGQQTGTTAPETGATDATNPEASRPEMPGMPMPAQPPPGAVQLAPEEIQ